MEKDNANNLKAVMKRRMVNLTNMPKEELIQVLKDEDKHHSIKLQLIILNILLVISTVIVAISLHSGNARITDLQTTILYIGYVLLILFLIELHNLKFLSSTARKTDALIELLRKSNVINS